MKLNEEQKKVVFSKERFLFLLAGAGSGKTRVIVERIRHRIEQGVKGEKILAITFTRKAAMEMRHRIGNSQVHVHTYHQFCYKTLKEHLNMRFDMADEDQIPFRKDEVLAVSRYKNSLYRNEKPPCYGRYQTYLQTHGLKDFDDLILEMIRALQSRYKVDYEDVYVDEFQDTNLIQFELLKLLVGKNTSVLAVGDPDQGIYGFRGASSKVIGLYVRHYQATVMTLSVNYRSSPEILSHANRIIRRNERTYKKELIPYHKTSCHAYAIHSEDEELESRRIHAILNHLKRLGVTENDIAILYRNHTRTFALQHYFHQHGIDTVIDEDHANPYAIHMMTIHQAKGLEFDAVILIGLEEGVLPSLQSNRSSEIEEERRLMFVAVTRAKRYLYLSHVTLNSASHRFPSSRFLRESGVKPIPIKVLDDIIAMGDFDEYQRADGRTDRHHRQGK